MSKVTLQIDGVSYTGWQQVDVVLGMEQMAGTFDLTITDSAPFTRGLTGWRIAEGVECRILLGDAVVITGYVDDVNVDYDSKSHSIQVSGRDRTGDLVDCAALHKPGVWQKVKLERIAADLCTPFGIKVLSKTGTGSAFSRFSIWPGETVFDALDRAARMRGVLLMADGQGNLVITRAGNERIATPLELGRNVGRASGQFSQRDRFSKYIVKGQAPGDSLNYDNPEQHLVVMATVADEAVKRYRPHVVIAEPGDGGTYKGRAIWERNVRAGRSNRVTYSVTGWRHAAGLWLPNRLVTVADEFMKLSGELVIAQVRMSLDETGGSHAELDLCSKEAFDMVPLPDPKEKKSKPKANATW